MRQTPLPRDRPLRRKVDELREQLSVEVGVLERFEKAVTGGARI
jgi:hypothetical protein